MNKGKWTNILFLTAFFISFISMPIQAQLKKKEYTIEKFAEGIYGFVWKDPLQNPIEGNSLFVINDQDVLVVDACLLPSSSRLMIKELKKLTTKPVRFVVNTHWHGDHANGNFVYKENWPAVEFIAHNKTRFDLIEQEVKAKPSIIRNFRDQLALYSKWYKDGKDDKGKKLDSARKVRVLGMVQLYKQMIDEIEPIKHAVPDLTFTDSLILYRSERIIKILWLGRGNTRGDAIIYLPKEKIASIGDLLVSPIPFAFGSYYKEWIQTLNNIDALKASILFPGHGLPYRDQSYLHQVRDLLTTLVQQVDSAVKNGMSLEETKKTVTLTEWKQKFAQGDGTKERSFDAWFIAPAVVRAWHQAKGNKEGE